MTTTGVEETYYKTFVLTEDGVRGFHKIMENAAQHFPAPAEVTYTIVTTNFRYFESTRLEDVLHDLEIQKRNIIQLIMDADFIKQPDHIKGEFVHKGTRENWNVRVTFSMSQRGLWEVRTDRISLRVQSEDRKWASDYIDRLEDQIYGTPRGSRIPNMIFWLFAIPLFTLVRTYLAHLGDFTSWLKTPFEQYAFFAYIAISAAMVLFGAASRFFNFNPSILRRLFGPQSAFVWGQGKYDYERREQIRQYTLLALGTVFIFFLIISINFSMH